MTSLNSDIGRILEMAIIMDLNFNELANYEVRVHHNKNLLQELLNTQ